MSPLETGPDNVVSIKVIGIGGAGNNAINRMVRSGMQGAEFIAVNTDKPALSESNADQKIQIGEKLTKGQGAGADPEIGRKAAEESRNELAKALENTSMVFIAGGMGGGTGTGAAPVIADIAREMGALTVGVVTKPFGFEGARRMKQAEEGISNLLTKVDALLVIPNDRLRHVTDQKITLANAFEIADDVLREAVSSIAELVMTTAMINLDFADVTSVMSSAGFSHIGIGSATGKNKAEEAVRQAIASPLMETSINGASGILINFTGSEDLALDDVYEAADLVREAANNEANIFFGARIDDSMDDKLSVVIVATKFGKHEQFNADQSVAKKEAKKDTSYFGGPAKAEKPVLPATAPAPAPVQEPVRQPEPLPVEEPAAPPQEEDPFDTIFKIFNSK